jgi:DNA polymerase-3 subunit delta
MKRNVYVFAGEGYMVRESLAQLKASLDIQMEELNVSVFSEMPTVDQLIEACAAVPFLSPMRLVAVRDCTALTAAGGKEDAKKIADYLDRLPDTTALALCVADAPDKRRTLYKRAGELGTVREFSTPSPADCAGFVAEQAARQGARIGRAAAQQLVGLVGCDYYALANEAAKLAVYSGGKEITAAHVNACVSRSLEYNVFEIHRLLVNRQSSEARAMLDDLLEDERPEMLIGLFARKMRDMYKVKTMLDAGFGQGAMASKLGMKPFAVQMLAKECARYTQEELRQALVRLADLDYGIKSGLCDASLALPETLARIYAL